MDMDLLQFLAARNVCDGTLYEPRLYSQLFDFSGAGIVNPMYSDEDIYRNGEQYPVRITHILAGIRDGSPGAIDERIVQAYSLRLRMLDTFYMNDDPVPLPLFHNTVTAASDIVTKSTSSWRFAHPFFMGNRDTIQVQVGLETPVDPGTEVSITAWVSFHGFGALSRRPKELHGFVTFTSTSPATVAIPDTFFRNDGTEPLEIHSMDCNVLPPQGSAGLSGLGNIRRASVNVRLVGNGTNQRWTSSDSAGPDLVPMNMFGLTTGRAVVHALPFAADNQRGWIWEPNQGITVEVTGPTSGPSQSQLYLAMVGEIIVK